MAPVSQYLRYTTIYDDAANARVRALAGVLRASASRGVREIYPGYGSVYVEWDDAILGSDGAGRWIDAAIANVRQDDPPCRQVEIPVAFGGADSADVAAAAGIDDAELVALLASTAFRVCALGASAGQPMLGGTPQRLAVPRRPHPRSVVPALSVAIANRQATVYPVAMPGGWSLVGTALVTIFDPHRQAPFLLETGDHVRFLPSAGEPPSAPLPLRLLPDDPTEPALLVETPGALDLVVDGGRLNQAHLGMAQSGPLDAAAARLANRLCGNAADAPLLECTLVGPDLRVLRAASVAATGQGLRLEVDGEPVGHVATRVLPGQRLRLRPTGRGARGYLSVAGGIETGTFLGSSSTDVRCLVGSALRAGDVIGRAGDDAAPRLSARFAERPAGAVLRLLRGPQWSSEAERALVSAPFVVGAGDRMGVHLAGPVVPGGEILSESPPPGSVQITSGGSPILLLADRQRSAGYDKPAVIHPADLSRAGQLRAGDEVRFVVVGENAVPWYRDLG